MATSAFALFQSPHELTVDTYVRQHVVYFLDQLESSTSWLDAILKRATEHATVSSLGRVKPQSNSCCQDALLRAALSLWSAHRLLMTGWQLTVPGDLGMFPVTEQGSLLNGTTPAPRVLQNQLDRILAQYCADKELECLKELQKFMRRESKRPWIVIFIVTILLLHVRERDIWRLLYWTLSNNGVSVPYLIS